MAALDIFSLPPRKRLRAHRNSRETRPFARWITPPKRFVYFLNFKLFNIHIRFYPVGNIKMSCRKWESPVYVVKQIERIQWGICTKIFTYVENSRAVCSYVILNFFLFWKIWGKWISLKIFCNAWLYWVMHPP